MLESTHRNGLHKGGSDPNEPLHIVTILETRDGLLADHEHPDGNGGSTESDTWHVCVEPFPQRDFTKVKWPYPFPSYISKCSSLDEDDVCARLRRNEKMLLRARASVKRCTPEYQVIEDEIRKVREEKKRHERNIQRRDVKGYLRSNTSMDPRARKRIGNHNKGLGIM